MSRLTEKAQVFYGDAIIGIIIFSLAVVLYMAVSDNFTLSENQVMDQLSGDATAITSSLITAGNPANWTLDTVTSIGLTDGNYRLMQDKVLRFMNMSYNTTTSMFGTTADYMVFFKDIDGNVLFFDKCAFGNTPSYAQNISLYTCENLTLPNSTSMVASERLLSYNSRIIKLVAYAWV